MKKSLQTFRIKEKIQILLTRNYKSRIFKLMNFIFNIVLDK